MIYISVGFLSRDTILCFKNLLMGSKSLLKRDCNEKRGFLMTNQKSLQSQKIHGARREIQWLNQSIEEWGSSLHGNTGLQEITESIRNACARTDEILFQAACMELKKLTENQPELSVTSAERIITLHRKSSWFEIRRSRVHRLAMCSKYWLES